MPSWAFFNPSITSTAEADWKASLSPSESLSTCFCRTTATVLSNAVFLGGTGAGGVGWMGVGPEGAGLVGCLEGAGLASLGVIFLQPSGDIRNFLNLLTRACDATLLGTLVSGAKGISTAAWVEVELEGAGLGSLDDVSRRLGEGTRGLFRLLITSSAPRGMLSQPGVAAEPGNKVILVL